MVLIGPSQKNKLAIWDDAGNAADCFGAMRLRSPSNARLGVEMRLGGARGIASGGEASFLRRLRQLLRLPERGRSFYAQW